MDNSTVASNCTVIGANALGGSNSGDGNVAIGVNSMLNNTTGAYCNINSLLRQVIKKGA